MSSDTAAFFAKKKKKAFKFNANLVDAEALTSRDHVDAPAVSTDAAGGGGSADAAVSADAPARRQEEEGQWDDTALASNFARRAGVGAAGLLDMKSLDGAAGSVNIADKLRREETKAQLTAAREGMEREAQLLKEKKEQAEAKKLETSNRFSDAAAAMGGGSRWMAPSLSRVKMGASGTGGGNRRFNVEDEDLFPDLASAGKILEQKEKEQQLSYKPVKKTPVGGGASWASKPKVSESPNAVNHESQSQPTKSAPELKPEPAAEAPAEEHNESALSGADATSASPDAVAGAGNMPKIAPMKKKKKDLSTFKPTS